MSNVQLDNQSLEAMRHSLAHIFAAAVQKIYPEAQFGVGPVVENGFYYDIKLEQPLSDKDLPKIEKAMKKIVLANLPMERHEWPIEQAIGYFQEKNQPFKVELLRD